MSNFEKVTIRIPAVPTREVSPNGRVHWRKKHRVSTELKNAAMWTLRSHYLDTLPDAPWRLDYTVALPRNAKKWDDDNMIAGLKPMRDGIAAEAGIDDRHMVTGRVEQIRDKDGVGYTEVTITGGKAP